MNEEQEETGKEVKKVIPGDCTSPQTGSATPQDPFQVCEHPNTASAKATPSPTLQLAPCVSFCVCENSRNQEVTLKACLGARAREKPQTGITAPSSGKLKRSFY